MVQALFQASLQALAMLAPSLPPSRLPGSYALRASKQDRWRPLSTSEKLKQPMQLGVAIWLLLLLPAGLASSPRRLCGGWSLGSLPFEYMSFFLGGTIPRAWRFGTYARPTSAKVGARLRDFATLGSNETLGGLPGF